MVVVKSVRVRNTPFGVESEALITAANGDHVSARDLGLLTISYVKSVTPVTWDHIAGAAAVDNPGSIGNDVALQLYSLTANKDSLVAAGSVDWVIVAVQ